jgi:hypothetical protein
MRIKRIELEGPAGHVAIERLRGESTIRIDSIVREPRGEHGWMTWEVPAGDREELYRVADAIQRRSDGACGSDSDIHTYYRELLRLAD